MAVEPTNQTCPGLTSTQGSSSPLNSLAGYGARGPNRRLYLLNAISLQVHSLFRVYCRHSAGEHEPQHLIRLSLCGLGAVPTPAPP